jgi:hypothetical protein
VALTRSQALERFASVGMPVSYTDKPHGFALQVRVRDLQTTSRILSANGVTHGQTARGVAVAPEAAGNTVIEFVE